MAGMTAERLAELGDMRGFSYAEMVEIMSELRRLRTESDSLKDPSKSVEGITEREKLIRTGFCFDSDRDCNAARYLIGVIDVIRDDRTRLRAENDSLRGERDAALETIREWRELLIEISDEGFTGDCFVDPTSPCGQARKLLDKLKEQRG